MAEEARFPFPTSPVTAKRPDWPRLTTKNRRDTRSAGLGMAESVSHLGTRRQVCPFLIPSAESLSRVDTSVP